MVGGAIGARRLDAATGRCCLAESTADIDSIRPDLVQLIGQRRRAASASAALPEIVSVVVPQPVTAAPPTSLAESWPVASERVTVMPDASASYR